MERVLGDEQKTGSSGNVVYEEDDESALDREKDQPSSAGNVWYLQEIDDKDKEKTIKIFGTCIERRKPRKTLPDGNDRRKQSERKTKRTHNDNMP